jgi:ABC-type polar amino acid transport system ATPase subunit
MSVLRIDNLCLRRGTRDILRGVSFTIDRGEIVALMGASGSGKTTILRCIVGLESPNSGVIDVLPPPGGGEKTGAFGMVFQFHCLFEHLTALDNVTLAPRHVGHVDRHVSETRARQLLDELGVGHRAHALPRELSGGEAQRVAIARALAMDPPLLLMDEPTASLDPERRAELAATLRALAGSGRAIVLTSHDEDFVERAGARVIRLAGGLITSA